MPVHGAGTALLRVYLGKKIWGERSVILPARPSSVKYRFPLLRAGAGLCFSSLRHQLHSGRELELQSIGAVIVWKPRGQPKSLFLCRAYVVLTE